MALKRMLKSIAPKGLLGRSLVILVTPLIVVQIVSAYVFYGTHWDLVTRHLAFALSGDIATVIDLMREYPGLDNRARIFAIAEADTEMRFVMHDGAILQRTGMKGAAPRVQDIVMGYSLRDSVDDAFNAQIHRPFFIDTETYPREIVVEVQLTDGVLDVLASRKRLYSPTNIVVVLWTVGTSLLLFGIATIFMRNQVRSVRRLAAAADSFGKGQDVPDFRPSGAAEVRQAATAFARMRDRIKRHVDERTALLAGVSHDLRTPLTRMKLQLAMTGGEGVDELNADVVEMERMIEGYLAFARGEDAEPNQPTDIAALVAAVAGKLRRVGATIDCHAEEPIVLTVRPHSMERCLTNLIGNAVRYGDHVAVRTGRRGEGAEVLIDDDGPGVPPDRREDVFRPFVRLEASRNPRTGGVGLGLTIARDIARGHGGDITLSESPMGGLRVRLFLPA